jgi:hypothetical protein
MDRDKSIHLLIVSILSMARRRAEGRGRRKI